MLIFELLGHERSSESVMHKIALCFLTALIITYLAACYVVVIR